MIEESRILYSISIAEAVPVGHASSAYTLDLYAAHAPNTGIGIGTRYINFLRAASARETRRIWSLPENLLPLFGRLGYNPKPDAGVAKW